MLGQFQGRFGTLGAFRHLFQARFSRRDDGHFGQGEKTVQQNQKKNYRKFKHAVRSGSWAYA
jgi:hypothetical protein